MGGHEPRSQPSTPATESAATARRSGLLLFQAYLMNNNKNKAYWCLKLKLSRAILTEEMLDLLQGNKMGKAPETASGQRCQDRAPAGAAVRRPPCRRGSRDPWGTPHPQRLPEKNLFLESPGGNICPWLLWMLSKRELSRHMVTGNQPNEGGGGGINSHLSPLLL